MTDAKSQCHVVDPVGRRCQLIPHGHSGPHQVRSPGGNGPLVYLWGDEVDGGGE